jgi:RNA-binding protein YhbY
MNEQLKKQMKQLRHDLEKRDEYISQLIEQQKFQTVQTRGKEELPSIHQA